MQVSNLVTPGCFIQLMALVPEAACGPLGLGWTADVVNVPKIYIGWIPGPLPHDITED